jgi:hypothetical protein
MSIEGNEASQRCIQHIQQNNNWKFPKS